jgi:hypothetical protein
LARPATQLSARDRVGVQASGGFVDRTVITANGPVPDHAIRPYPGAVSILDVDAELPVTMVGLLNDWPLAVTRCDPRHHQPGL